MNFENLENIFIRIKSFLNEGVNSSSSGFHTVNVCTVEKNSPKIRTVVLRNFDEENFVIYFHTDKRSQKINHLKENSNISLHFYSLNDKTQLIIEGSAEILNSGEYFENAWENTKSMSRKCYFLTEAPGIPLKEYRSGLPEVFQNRSPLPSESEEGKQNFTVVKVQCKVVEFLYLRAKGNIRARFKLDYAGKMKQCEFLIP
ncbi:MAG: pyridoxamine 5'-phosphate oxidase family protein [Ignavibacteriaceae bacterium]|nr:pyridoxamine 5'-phosphate oxidase family protein [Ignavibacteriaceae bacterium]